MFHERLSSEIFFQHKTRGLREAQKCAWNNSTRFIIMLRVKVRPKSAPIEAEKVRQNVGRITESAPKKSAPRKVRGRGYGPQNGSRYHGQKCATKGCEQLVARGRCVRCRRREWCAANKDKVNAASRRKRARKPRTWPCLDCGRLGASLRCKPCAARNVALIHLVIGPRDARGRRRAHVR
jgi:hypothetical protein